MFTISYLEDVLEAPVVLLEDGVLGGEVEGEAPPQRVLHGGVGKVPDGGVRVVHAHGDAGALELVDLEAELLAAVGGLEGHGEGAGAGDEEVGGAVLVAVRVSADHNGLGPGRDQAGNVLADDGLTGIQKKYQLHN